ncbi:hypothetical protein J6S55_00155 [Candidatus Saccharibacteria bacterium]|nr:hypothetical protein [Candidatus Saccharibacteria bacterium]
MAEEKKNNKGLIAAICAAVVAVIVAVVVVVVINLNNNGIVGKYNLVSTIDSEGNEVDATAAGNMMEYTIELKGDKTGTMVMKIDMSAYSDYVEDPSQLKSETTLNVTYDDKTMTVDNNGQKAVSNYEYKDGVLTLELNGQKMKFKKA